jgi:hypothetical protein
MRMFLYDDLTLFYTTNDIRNWDLLFSRQNTKYFNCEETSSQFDSMLSWSLEV